MIHPIQSVGIHTANEQIQLLFDRRGYIVSKIDIRNAGLINRIQKVSANLVGHLFGSTLATARQLSTKGENEKA